MKTKQIPEKEFRHRTDINAFKNIYGDLCNQVNILTSELGFNIPHSEKIEVGNALKDNIKNIIEVLIQISEQLHDYKDRELENSLKEIKDRENEPIDLNKG